MQESDTRLPAPRPATRDEAAALREGTLVGGRYLVAQCIGRGGVGVVHAALDLTRPGPVALKVVNPSDEAARRRFDREARLGRDLGAASAGVVRCLDSGVLEDGRPFLVCDLVEGSKPLELTSGTLDERLDRLAGAIALVAEVHALGVIHRDLKPANFLVDGEGSVRLADFGVAKRLRDQDDDDAALMTVMLTEVGVGIGTPAFMPLEQFENARDVDARSDVFALGAMLHLALTGRVPYDGNAHRILSRQIRAVHDARGGPRARDLVPDVPPALDALCARATHPDAHRRLGSAAELLEALRVAREAPFALDAAREPPAREEAEAATQVDPALFDPATLRAMDHRGGTFDYEVVRRLGQGGLGVTYLARRSDGVPAVLKSSLGSVASAALSLEVEHRILMQVEHDNVIGYYGRTAGGALCLERAFPNPLELFNRELGSSPRAWQPLPPGVALELGHDLLRGLAHLHGLGFVHHDVKLGNFLVVPLNREDDLDVHTERLLAAAARSRLRGVLIDLGGARSVDYLEALSEGRERSDVVPPQLTPLLAPPEALLGVSTPRGLQRRLHPSLDLYAAGLTIYSMLTGRGPYEHLGQRVDDFEALLELKEGERAGDLRPISREALDRVPLDDVGFVAGSVDAGHERFATAIWEQLRALTGPLDQRPTAAEALARWRAAFDFRGSDSDPRPRQGVFTMHFDQNRLVAAARR